ncbi:hypothetical protein SDC9_190020 [bioreactor metagenome]|uniref:Uncharacterized protein n=1 Tax=bioreactor metagenome TaxID=1076179 RepID=A0A645I4Q5_9ZZZZ
MPHGTGLFWLRPLRRRRFWAQFFFIRLRLRKIIFHGRELSRRLHDYTLRFGVKNIGGRFSVAVNERGALEFRQDRFE